MNKVKSTLTLFMLLTVSSLVNSQTGPGGVGNSVTLEAWVNASSLNLSDGDPINTWTDLSGNGNDATVVGGYSSPTLESATLNGEDVALFSGTENLEFSTNIVTEETTIFSIHNKIGSSNQVPFTFSNHAPLESNSCTFIYFNPISTAVRLVKLPGSYSILSLSSDPGLSGVNATLRVGTTVDSETRNEGRGYNTSNIGCRNRANPNYTDFFSGRIAELIYYNTRLSDAERIIVNEYLGVKYNLTREQSLYSYAASHHHELKGIGQTSDGSNTIARGTDRLEILNASSLGNGDYVLIASDGADYSISTSVPSSAVDRWNRTWRVDITGTPGDVDLRFYLDGGTLPGAINDLVVLGETNDQDFSNGDVSVIASGASFVFNSGDSYVQFNNVSLTDGMTIALAEYNTDVNSVGDGDWSTPATWSCNCVPNESNNVTIQNTHDITLSANQSALALNIQAGGSLALGANTLSVFEDLSISGTFDEGTGTLSLEKQTDGQLVYNNTGTTQNLYNLRVDNNQGVSFENGDWSLSHNLEVNAGGMDVSNATSFTLQSDASGSSQILESMSNAFTGNFTIQRYISDRQTSYANVSAPVSNADAGDLDDDFYLSGLTGGADADILLAGSTIFYSVWQYNAATATHEEITNVSTALTPARGYEVYIEPNARTYTSGAMDYEGTPNSGTASISLSQGFNLVGNPYHSFINFGNLSASGMSSTFYIWDTDAGNYATLGNTDNIAPAQGFWVNKTTAGSTTLNFNENDKVNSNANTFLREKKGSNGFNLKLSNQVNQYTHELAVRFDPNASASIDEGDAFYLPSPLKEAPALVAKIEGSAQGLVINNLNQWEDAHRIPVELRAGVEGNYSIQAEDLESLYEQYSCVYLHDQKENKSIDLSVEPTYEFFAEAGKQQRFELLLANSFANCEQAMSQGGVNQKIEDRLKLRNVNGQWFLNYQYEDQLSRNLEIKVLNLNGQEVISTQSIGVSGFGTYQLEGLEDLNGIYLIQIQAADEFINQKVKL